MNIPEMPPFDELEASASADEPSIEGAWWIATQSTIDLLTAMSRRDGYTGRGLPDSMREMLMRLDEALVGPARPLPRDTMFRAMELCQEALEAVLMEPRTRLVRRHEMVPIHAAGEVDKKTMRWLGRLPGRTAREKLAGRDKMKAPKRRFIANTRENRVVRRVIELFQEHVDARDKYFDAYDGDNASEAVRRLKAMRRLCGVQLRNSPLSDVDPAVQMRANNVMLDDRRYARVWRAAKLLRKRRQSAESGWKQMPRRAREIAFWGIVARLIRSGAVFWNRPGIIGFEEDERPEVLSVEDLVADADGGQFVELWLSIQSGDSEPVEDVIGGRVRKIKGTFGFIQRDDGPDVYFNRHSLKEPERFEQVEKGNVVRFQLGTPPNPDQNPPAKELVLVGDDDEESGMILRIELDGQTLSVKPATLPEVGITCPNFARESTEYEINFDLPADSDAGRGFPCSIPFDLLGNRVDRGRPVDPQGLRQLIDMVEQRLLTQVLGDEQRLRGGGEVESPPGGQASSDVAGVDFGPTCPSVTRKKTELVQVSGYAVGFNLDGTDFWEVETELNPVFPPGVGDQDASTSSVFSAERGETNDNFSGVRHLVEELADHPVIDTADDVGYAVPDLADEEAKRRFRALLEGRLRPRRVVPIWRSVAAAVGWQSGDESLVDGEDQLILVVDADASQLTITPLISCRDEELAQQQPDTGGIYWERRPPMPVEDSDDLLTTRCLLTDYATNLVNEHCGEEYLWLVDYLVDSGRIERLIETGEVVAPVNDDTGKWMRLVHDTELWQRCRNRWFKLFDERITQQVGSGELDGLRDDHLLATVVLTGYPFANTPELGKKLSGLAIGDHNETRQQGLIKFVNHEKNYGFIRRLGEQEDVFLHRGSLRNSELFEQLKDNTPVRFETRQGDKGPKAVDLTAGVPADICDVPQLGEGLAILTGRAKHDQVTWAEWMPQLGIEVIKDGHFGVLPLLTEGRGKVSHTGRRETVELDERLRLPADHDQILLPMLSGDDGREVIGLQAQLAGGSLSLSEPATVNLEFGFMPGVDGDWSITVAAPSNEQSIGESTARWISHVDVHGNRRSRRLSPEFPYSDSQRSLSTQKEARELFKQIEATRDDTGARKEKCHKLVKVLGTGQGERAEFVQKTLDLIRSFRSFEHFNPALANATISGLGNALWDFSELVKQLPKVDDDAIELLLDVSDKGLRNIASRLPMLADELRDDPDPDLEKLNIYVSPYRNICRLLMALLRLRDVGEYPLLAPSQRCIGRMARYIRRIDAQLANFKESEVDRPDIVGEMLKVNKEVAPRPRKLRRVSRLGYQTMFFLIGGKPPLAELA